MYSESLPPTRCWKFICSDYDNNYACNQRVVQTVCVLCTYIYSNICIVLRQLKLHLFCVVQYCKRSSPIVLYWKASLRAMHLLPSVNISHVNFLNVSELCWCVLRKLNGCDNLPPFEDDLPLEMGKGISIRGSGNHKPSK